MSASNRGRNLWAPAVVVAFAIVLCLAFALGGYTITGLILLAMGVVASFCPERV